MKSDNSSKRAVRKRSARKASKPTVSARAKPHNKIAGDEYRVGPGKPPREYQFKPGQSGNPKGPKRKTSSIAPDLKEMLERALNEKIKLGRGEGKQIVTKAAAGIQQLVDGFARGDRSARRDLIIIAQKLGYDLTRGQGKVIENALNEVLAVDDQALLDDYFRRYARRYIARANADGIDRLQDGDATGPENSEGEGRDP
jgi:hypothetical protein